MAAESKYFVFLEFANPKVRHLIADLRTAISGQAPRSGVHITVRGPYKTPPGSKRMFELEERIRETGVIIGGAGTFKTEEGFVVFLKAQSPAFSEIWWKPDFPNYLYGMKPHITIFETENPRAAKLVEMFLRTEKIEIFTLSLRLTVYQSKQIPLFELDSGREVRKQLENWERWKVRPGLLSRAEKLREELEDMAQVRKDAD